MRSLWRERETLVKDAAWKVQHMQKALFQMIAQLSNVINDITGKTGLAIMDAILIGERDVNKLSAYRDHRIHVDQRTELYRIFGNDLTQVPAIQSSTISVFLSEVGPSVARFEKVKRFASWLGLCPDNRIKGGRILSARRTDVKSRLASTL